MDDITGKLTDLLSDSETLDRLKGLSGLLGLSASSSDEAQNAAPDNNTGQDSSGADIFGMIMKLMPIINALSAEDENVRLLNALRPFISKDKQKKMDTAIMLVKLMRIIPLLKDVGLFGIFGGN